MKSLLSFTYTSLLCLYVAWLNNIRHSFTNTLVLSSTYKISDEDVTEVKIEGVGECEHLPARRPLWLILSVALTSCDLAYT
jgi:hypothetical protein